MTRCTINGPREDDVKIIIYNNDEKKKRKIVDDLVVDSDKTTVRASTFSRSESKRNEDLSRTVRPLGGTSRPFPVHKQPVTAVAYSSILLHNRGKTPLSSHRPRRYPLLPSQKSGWRKYRWHDDALRNGPGPRVFSEV